MITEIAALHVKAGQGAEFERAFAEAATIIAAQPGYMAHSLHKHSESAGNYLLQVEWESIGHLKPTESQRFQ
ncbi:MAG: hypothetical protein LDLANPLL_00928 [Turneriella sp.]|nr:hypothetical protein [Turneriella sp.]